LIFYQGVRDALAESGDEDMESEELIEKQVGAAWALRTYNFLVLLNVIPQT